MQLTAQSEVQQPTAAPVPPQNVLANVARVVVGKPEAARLCMVALIGGGHALLEDVPGVGKTVLVRALARSLDCDFKRIQFTPDLLPSDVTGTAVFNQRVGDFEYRTGPIFSQIVLADEINRTSPKTQSALLEALEEHSVSFDGQTYRLPEPFFVLATQNPIDYEGTFPLPEAQLDRFMLRFGIGYPTREQEIEVLLRGVGGCTPEELSPVASPTDVFAWRDAAARVHIDALLYEYIVDIAARTRQHASVYLGVSPRGAIALARAAQAQAFLSGRDFVLPDDVKALAFPALSHRILLTPETRISGLTAERVLDEILRSVPVPVVPHRR